MTQHNAALVEETNAAIEQTEAQARELDEIVDVFITDSEPAPARTAPARRSNVATTIKAHHARAKSAAGTYLSQGNAAVKADWDEF